MVYLFFTALFLSIWHLLYESVIAPSLRMHFRNQLFEQRDKLRRICIEGLHPQDNEAFELVHEGINRFLNRLAYLHTTDFVKTARALENDPTFRARIDKRVNTIQSAKDNEIREIWERTGKIVSNAMTANFSGWAIYLMPIVLIMLTVSTAKRLLRDPMIRFANDLMVAPQYAVRGFFVDTPDIATIPSN